MLSSTPRTSASSTTTANELTATNDEAIAANMCRNYAFLDPDTPIPSIETDPFADPETDIPPTHNYQTCLATQRKEWLKMQLDLKKYCEDRQRQYRRIRSAKVPPVRELSEEDCDQSDDGTEYDYHDFQTPPRPINLITKYQRRLAVSWSPSSRSTKVTKRAGSVRPGVGASGKRIIWKPYRSSAFLH